MKRCYTVIMSGVLTIALLFVSNYFMDFGYRLPYKNPRPLLITVMPSINPTISESRAREILLRGDKIPDNYSIAIGDLIFKPEGNEYVAMIPYHKDRESLYNFILYPPQIDIRLMRP